MNSYISNILFQAKKEVQKIESGIKELEERLEFFNSQKIDKKHLKPVVENIPINIEKMKTKKAEILEVIKILEAK